MGFLYWAPAAIGGGLRANGSTRSGAAAIRGHCQGARAAISWGRRHSRLCQHEAMRGEVHLWRAGEGMGLPYGPTV